MTAPDADAMRNYMRGLTQRLHPVPGGCASCDAEQRVAEVADGVFQLAVYHDASCAEYGNGAEEPA